jgi:hypothetical protein
MLIDGYQIFRSTHPETGYVKVGFVPSGINNYVDKQLIEMGKLIHEVKNNIKYYYKVRAKHKDEFSNFSNISEATCFPQWFDFGKLNIFIGVIILVSSVLFFIRMARRGTRLFIRKIAGLEALDEAVGRATEMGKPVLYIPGLSGISDIATIASINILGRVAKRTAEYGTRLLVPNVDPIVLTVTKQVVKESYESAGRPDLFHDEDIYYLAGSQFAFALGVSGIMARERPSTNLFIGMFWAESLILAESGSATGAIQIAGTDAITQLPFFITSCDYTIIGEELYAASAYLSEEPKLVGSIKAQDLLKGIILAMIIVGTIFMMLGNNFIFNLLKT